MQIFDEDAIDCIDQIDQLQQQGIHAFRIVLSVENKSQSQAIRQRFLQKVQEKGWVLNSEGTLIFTVHEENGHEG